MIKQEDKFVDALRKIRTEGSKVEAALLCTTEGMPLKWSLVGDLAEDLTAITTATLSLLGHQTVDELGVGPLHQMVLKAKVGYAIVNLIGADLILIVLSNKESNLGINLYLISQVCTNLSTLK